MRYGDLTYKEIQRCSDGKWLIVIPTGCTEQQGPHLPVDFDTWFVDQVTTTASEKAKQDYGVGSLVLPVIPFGPTPEHRNFKSGYIDIPSRLHDSLLEAVLHSISEQGFRTIIICRGCGQHDFKNVVNHFNDENHRRTKAYIPDFPYNDIMQQVAPGILGGHADSFSTSIAMYLRPDSVRLNEIPTPEIKPVNWEDPNLDFTKYSSSGVIGDPSYASYELGRKLWHKVIDSVVITYKKYAEM